MRCEDVRKQLEIDPRPSRLPDRVRAHLLECPGCRRTQALYEGIEQELREQPAWQPPSGFVQRVGLQGLGSLGGAPAKPRFIAWGSVGPALAAFIQPLLLGLLAATFSLVLLLKLNALVAGYPQLVTAFSKAMLANILPLAWITAILSLCLSFWLTRRALG